MNETGRKRWIWDLYPLAKDSWGSWYIEENQARPDHRVYLYRRAYDDHMDAVEPIAKLFEQDSCRMQAGQSALQNIIHREGFCPSDDDFALLKRLYPNSDPHRPDWYRIKADLATVERDNFKLVNSEAPVLLAWLAKAKDVQNDKEDKPKQETASPNELPKGRRITSVETHQDNIALTGIDQNGPKTFGALLDAIERSEYAYSQNMATAEKKQGGEAHWWRMQAAVLVFRPGPSEWPGVDVLEAICQAESGSGLTAENLRRIRGAFITDSGMAPAVVDAMTVGGFVAELHRVRQNIGGYRGRVPSIAIRSACCLVVFAGLESVAMLCAWRWGAGENAWQRITNSWVWCLAAFGASAFASRFLWRTRRFQLPKPKKGQGA